MRDAAHLTYPAILFSELYYRGLQITESNLMDSYTLKKFFDKFTKVGIGFAEFYPHAGFPSPHCACPNNMARHLDHGFAGKSKLKVELRS